MVNTKKIGLTPSSIKEVSSAIATSWNTSFVFFSLLLASNTLSHIRWMCPLNVITNIYIFSWCLQQLYHQCNSFKKKLMAIYWNLRNFLLFYTLEVFPWPCRLREGFPGSKFPKYRHCLDGGVSLLPGFFWRICPHALRALKGAHLSPKSDNSPQKCSLFPRKDYSTTSI